MRMNVVSMEWLRALGTRERLLVALPLAAAAWQLVAPGALMAHGFARIG